MTTLELSSVPRKMPWSALRLATGALLLFVGLSMFVMAWKADSGMLIGLACILCGLGIAACFQSTAEQALLPAAAIVIALVPFSLFIAMVAKKDPFEAIRLMYQGSFGNWFSFQNTLTRAAPLMLTGLCTALPMRLGFVMIGGEGALVIGALAAAGAGHAAQVYNSPVGIVILAMLLAGAAAGGVWICIAGMLKHYRGVNETISSLLLIYIAIAILNHVVEGPWRDPASLNKPSTWPIATKDGDMVMGSLGFIDFSSLESSSWYPLRMLSAVHFDSVHWGLVVGVVACLLCWVIMNHTTFGFSAQVVGGNVRAAKVAGLPIGKIIIITCLLAGAMAGMAGAVEVAAVQGSANATVIAGYGYTGILVAFLARQNPFAIIPVALLLGGIEASNGLLQRRLQLPDATVRVLQGTLFLVILASETYYGRLKFFQKKEEANV